ncbi:restriction endonuclease subunit S [Clostridium sp. 2218st1_F5_2218SCRN_220325]|uniref:restriction endonuclease subunit S n=1 Tax=Clostridium sp. 2218st1_F5_2218SCRN_220325 TaxID=3143056 RepID=UPI00319D88BD
MEYVKLKDVFSIKKGKKVEQVEKSENTIRYIQIDDLRNNDNIKYCEKNERYVYAQERDIIIAWDGANAGTIGYGLNGAIGSTLALLTKNDDRFCTEYCGLFLKSKFKYLRDKCTGATIPHISKSSLEELEIPLISKEEQLKIINIINLSKNLLDKKKDQINLLDELVKSRFIEMFGNPLIDEKNFGIKKLSEVTIINPKKMEVKELDQTLNVSFVPMDKVGEKGQFNSELVKTIKDVYSGFTYFKEKDVLFAKITPCMENGKGAIAKDLKNGIGFGSTEFHVIRPIKEKTNSYWIYHLTTLIEFRRLAERKMTGSAGQKRVPSDFFINIQVVVPPIELQNQFADFVTQVDKLKFEMEKSLKELEDNFNSLMQKAFKGELF